MRNVTITIEAYQPLIPSMALSNKSSGMDLRLRRMRLDLSSPNYWRKRSLILSVAVFRESFSTCLPQLDEEDQSKDICPPCKYGVELGSCLSALRGERNENSDDKWPTKCMDKIEERTVRVVHVKSLNNISRPLKHMPPESEYQSKENWVTNSKNIKKIEKSRGDPTGTP